MEKKREWAQFQKHVTSFHLLTPEDIYKLPIKELDTIVADYLIKLTIPKTNEAYKPVTIRAKFVIRLHAVLSNGGELVDSSDSKPTTFKLNCIVFFMERRPYLASIKQSWHRQHVN